MVSRRRLLFSLAVVVASALLGPGVEATCTSPLIVVSAQATGSTVSAIVANPTSAAASGYLVIEVMLGSSSATSSVPLTAPPTSSVGVDATYSSAVQLIGVHACGVPPTGIGESPDPVVTIKEKQKRE